MHNPKLPNIQTVLLPTVLHKVYELLESVNVVIVNWVLALVPAGAFKFGEGH